MLEAQHSDRRYISQKVHSERRLTSNKIPRRYLFVVSVCCIISSDLFFCRGRSSAELARKLSAMQGQPTAGKPAPPAPDNRGQPGPILARFFASPPDSLGVPQTFPKLGQDPGTRLKNGPVKLQCGRMRIELFQHFNFSTFQLSLKDKRISTFQLLQHFNFSTFQLSTFQHSQHV